MLTKRKVVVLTSYYLHLYEVDNNHVTPEFKVDLTTSLKVDIEKAFEPYAGQSVRMLVNLYEEEFIFIDVPHCSPLERKKLMQRKLTQHFKGHEFTRAFYQGRKSSGRKDDAVLLSSLGECEKMRMVVDVLFDLELAITGIYSVQSMCKSFLQPLMEGRDVLFMTEIDNGNPSRIAVRQSFYKGGILKLSRVANIYVNNEATLREDVENELETSRLFLIREHYIDGNSPLPVVFVHSTHYLRELSSCPGEMGEHFILEHVSTPELAAMLDIELEGETEEVKFEEISAVGSLTTLAGSHYNNSKTHYHQRHSILSKCLDAASILGLAASLFFCAGLLLSGYQKENDASLKMLSAQSTMQQAVNARDKVDRFSDDITQIQHAVDFVQSVKLEKIPFEDILNHLGRAIAGYPNIVLDRIELSSHSEAIAVADTSDEMESDDADEGWDEEFSYDDEVVEMQDALSKVVVFARPDVIGTDVRRIMVDVDRLASTLRKSPDVVRVDIIEYPFNLEQSSELKGKVSNLGYETLSQNTDFKIEVIVSNEQS